MTTHAPPPMYDPKATLVIVPVEPQPVGKEYYVKESPTYQCGNPNNTKLSDGGTWGFYRRPTGYWGKMFTSPFTVGDRIGCKEEWGWSSWATMPPCEKHKDEFLIYTGGAGEPFGGRPASTMPDWAIRKYSTVTAVGVGCAGKVTDSEAVDMRMPTHIPGISTQPHIQAQWRDYFTTAYPQHADNFDSTWIWKLTMEVQDES